MFGIKQFFILNFAFVIADASCDKSSSQDNFSYLPIVRLKMNNSIPQGQVFCSQDGRHPRFALTRGKIPHMESVIGVYRKNQQSQICYYKNINNEFLDVTTLTGGDFYIIGNCILATDRNIGLEDLFPLDAVVNTL